MGSSSSQMQKILFTTKLYISQSKIPKADRGVFAKTEINVGEIIESCPVIEIPKYDLVKIEESIFINYVFFFGKQKERGFLALGFGSIYNHSYTPKAVYKIKPKEGKIEFISIKNIKKGDEITVNYIQGKNINLPLWFEV